MKRSEMVKKIHDTFIGRSTFSMNENWAEILLTMMEEVGMSPPAYTSLPTSYNRSEGTYGYPMYEWEDEDEKK